MRAIRCAVAALLVAGIVTVVGAQPRPGGGGGFGGGSDVTNLVLSNKALQEELKITDEQKEKFKPLAEKQTEQFKKAFSAGKDQDKQKEIREEGKKLNEEIKKALDESLTSAQKKRIKQINIQGAGVELFGEPREGKGGFGGTSEATKALMKEVGESLKLTDTQKTKLKEIVAEHSKDVRAIRVDIFGEKGGFGGKVDPDKQKEFTTKSTKRTEETWEKINGALEDAQKKTWKELTGEPFDRTKLIPMQPKKD